MRDAGSTSPFRAKNNQAQKEQWIWWQCQPDAATPVEAPPVNALPERERSPMQPMQPMQPVPPVQPTRHQQYDAMMRRMKAAQGKTGAFTACGTSTQPSSGS